MTAREDLEALIGRELRDTVTAANGGSAFLTYRYHHATAKILAAADLYALEVADTPLLTAQRQQVLADLTKRGPRAAERTTR